MSFLRHEAIYNTHSEVSSITSKGPLDIDGNLVEIDENLVSSEIEKLKISIGMIKLRIKRDRLLQECDWEVTRGIEEGIDITELKTYRSALRNLPQEIETGNIEAPTLDENGELVFNSWPVRGTE